MSACKNCLKILVCKYNDGHNLYCKNDYECPHFLDKAVIEKQIPKKPILDTIFPSGVKWWSCPVCRHNNIETNDRFCHNCGQALDWSDTE